MSRHRRRTRGSWIALAAVLIAAPRAQAHLTNTGLGPFYDGIVHVLSTPADLLLIVALSLYAGLRGIESGRAALFAIPASWLAGGLAGMQFGRELALPVATTLVLVTAGALVAVDLRMHTRAVVALAVGAGAFQGLLNGSSMAAAGAGLRGLAGIASASFVIVALLAALCVRLGDGWRRIAIRVAGSWIAAIGMLMLGWAMR